MLVVEARLEGPDGVLCLQVEDLTDAAFTQLHQPYEDQERSRWTWMALAPAKRRGSRSLPARHALVHALVSDCRLQV